MIFGRRCEHAQNETENRKGLCVSTGVAGSITFILLLETNGLSVIKTLPNILSSAANIREIPTGRAMQ